MAEDKPKQRPFFSLPKGPGDVKDYLVSKGWPEDRAEREAQKVAAQMLKTPQDWGDVVSLGLETAIPFLVARYIPGGGGLVQASKQVLANIGGQAAVGGITRAVRTGDPSQFVGGVVQSGVKSVPGALTQAGVGMALLPRKATVRAQQAIEDFQKGFSPEVGKVLDPANPKAMFSAQTVKRMMTTAGTKLDTMEAAVKRGVGDTLFDVPLKTSAAAPPLFGPSGTPITDPALRQLITRAQPGSQALASEGSTFADVRKRIVTLRTGAYRTPHAEMAAKRTANQLEDRLLADMRRKGFTELADQYRQALHTHARDMVGVRGIKWVQDQQRRPGGASPVDDPAIAQAMDHLASRGFGQEARLMLAGVFAAMRHPFLAAGEAIQAAKQMGKAVDVSRIKGPLTATPLRQAIPPTMGGALRLFLGPQTPTAPTNPARDELEQAEKDLGASDTHVGELDTLIRSLP